MAENHRNHENDELGRLDASDAKDRKILLTVLLINLTQSAAGIALGIWAGSTALMGAGLDNSPMRRSMRLACMPSVVRQRSRWARPACRVSC